LLTYSREMKDVFKTGAEGVAGGLAQFDPSHANAERRWMRGSLESCVKNVMKSDKLVTNYVATYKFNDPQWAPMLKLPCGNPIAFELRARHINVALRHLVQLGHALYLLRDVQHTVFHPRGIAERAMVTCSQGDGGNRLKTIVVHEGPLDAANPHGDRGVVGVSVAEGMAGPYVRWTMVLERTRRVGAIQAGMGAMDWTLMAPALTGRAQHEEVFLLEKHTAFRSQAAVSAGIVSSAHIAKHPFQYVTEFEAPSPVVADTFNQLAYFCGSQNFLFDAAGGEPLHALAWSQSGGSPIGVPLEVDLPFKVQCSRPEVCEDRGQFGSFGVGSPYSDGAPVFKVSQQLFQGSPEYLYDGLGPSSRPGKWWRQKDCLVAEQAAYYVRDGNIDKLQSFDGVPNPFLKGNGRGLAMLRVDLSNRNTLRREAPASAASTGEATSVHEFATGIRDADDNEDGVKPANATAPMPVGGDVPAVVDSELAAEMGVSEKGAKYLQRAAVGEQREEWQEAARTAGWSKPSDRARARKQSADVAASRIRGARIRPKPMQ
jgi:hypothetical protein